ncbi:MAG: Uma2 family endonuclease [Candidatus Latescibacterota bacterium]|nr:MAG: Uma2 family endonuclease [Candidatus Latescibacterota bacterium]
MTEAVARKKKVSYLDYLFLPDDGKRYEVIDGEVYMTPAPTTGHQDVLGRLWDIVFRFVSARGMGRVFFAPVDVVLSDYDVVQPDLIYVGRDREDIVHREGIRGAPDWVVEVTSPTTSLRDRVEKRALYERYGVGEYWVVDPEARQVEVWILEEGKYRGPEVYVAEDEVPVWTVPGLTVPLERVFG